MSRHDDRVAPIGCGRPSVHDAAVPCGQQAEGDGEPFIALCGVCIAVVMEGVVDGD